MEEEKHELNRKWEKEKEKEQGRIHGHQLRTGRGGNARFLTFRLDGYGRTDRRTNAMDQWTDKASYRVECPQLERKRRERRRRKGKRKRKRKRSRKKKEERGIEEEELNRE